MKSRAPCAVFSASIGSFLGCVPSARPGGAPRAGSSPSAPPRSELRRRRQQQRGGPRSEHRREEEEGAAGPPGRPSSSTARPSHADMGQGKERRSGRHKRPPRTQGLRDGRVARGRGSAPVTAPRPLPPAAAAPLPAPPRPAQRSATPQPPVNPRRPPERGSEGGHPRGGPAHAQGSSGQRSGLRRPLRAGGRSPAPPGRGGCAEGGDWSLRRNRRAAGGQRCEGQIGERSALSALRTEALCWAKLPQTEPTPQEKKVEHNIKHFSPSPHPPEIFIAVHITEVLVNPWDLLVAIEVLPAHADENNGMFPFYCPFSRPLTLRYCGVQRSVPAVPRRCSCVWPLCLNQAV